MEKTTQNRLKALSGGGQAARTQPPPTHCRKVLALLLLLLLFNQESQGSVLRRGWVARQKWGGLVLGEADALGLEAGRVAQRCPQATRARERGRFTSHGRVAPETAEAPETQVELRPSSPTGGCGAPTPGWLRRPGHRESCVHLHHRQAAATLPQAGWGAQV